MSDQTKADLEAAISVHVADMTEGNLLTDWSLVIASTSVDDIGSGATDYRFEANTGQPPHVSYGLLTYAIQASVWNEDDA